MLLKNALVLGFDPPSVSREDLRIDDGKIVERGALNALPAEPVEDLDGKLVMPGLCVGHTHLYSALACGMPGPRKTPADFKEMLEEVWWRLDRALDHEAVRLSALVGGTAALKAGVTCLVDHHASPSAIDGSLEIIDGALGGLGLRRILCYEVTDRGGEAERDAGLEAHRALLERGPTPESAVLVGGHANFTLCDASIEKMVELAKAHDVGIHLHLAEAEGDARHTGEALVPRLQRLGALLPGSLFAHCVHLNNEEIRVLQDAGCWVSHQPRSNMKNGVGYAAIEHFNEQTLLGTDGIGGDLFAELQSAWWKAQDAGKDWGPDRFLKLLAANNRFAASKLGLSCVDLQPGSPADLVVLDRPPGPALSGTSLAGAFLFNWSSAMVRHVMVAGKLRVKDRRVLAVDEKVLDLQAQAAANKVWQRMAQSET